MTIPAFGFTPGPSGTEFRLLADGQALAFARWPLVAPQSLLPGVERITAWIAAGEAIDDDAVVLVEHAVIAALSPREAALLDLPPLAEAMARVSTRGLITQPGFRASLQWCRPTGQPIVGPERIGAWLRIGGQLQRLPAGLFALAEAVDALAAATTADDRLRAIARLQEALPAAASASGLAAQIEVIEADAFSLDLIGTGRDARLVPILHHAGEAAPLLAPAQQAEFGERQFNGFSDVRPVYALSGNRFVVLPPVLRRCLAEIRRHQSASYDYKRALLANPRRHLQAALEADDDPTLQDQIEHSFIETPSWSDRVIGLGVWEKRALPWVARTPTDWFAAADAPRDPNGPPTRPLTRPRAEELRTRIESAIAAGEPYVAWHEPGSDAPPRRIPATRAMLSELQQRIDGAPAGSAPDAPLVLLILTNENEVEHEPDFTARASLPPGLPAGLATPPKPHQRDGISWLQQSWLAGAPGVLLADDMGLGKTLQGLAFLVWLREAMVAGRIARAPLLIVAPTGLLANWAAEHDRHLSGAGLGDCLAAFGSGLKQLRRPDGTLDQQRLVAADWVLTTYETLRNHSPDFGAVRFAVLLADEAQKVKTPGVRMTDALKAMQAEFRIAMTGTPVENRLADLWCITDGVRPGCLGSLETFSRDYEANPDPARLARLRSRLDSPIGGAPALMLRRMKEDHLPELPEARTHETRAPMPPLQHAAYRATRDAAREAPGAVLQALQRFRAIALHPDPEMEGDDAGFIAASARLGLCFAALDRAAERGERALVFIDSRAVQPRLAGAIQRRYRLAATPAIISGAVAGRERQARVDRFQQAPEGFDVMLLSPRAGGVGLTLTRANHVIHLDRWWNPAVEDQCTGRALRIGQQRTVEVHLPLATLPDGGAAFDDNLHALLTRKRRLTRDALLPGEPDKHDVQELFERTVAG
jgi:hypothetical protein